jgi:hypothetical protein
MVYLPLSLSLLFDQNRLKRAVPISFFDINDVLAQIYKNKVFDPFAEERMPRVVYDREKIESK